MTTRTDRIVDSIRRLVEAESPTSDLDACVRVCELATTIAGEWLPSAARIETHEGRPVVRWGVDQPAVLLLGHIDTVWPLGTLERLPWSCDGERMTGPGVFDMKTGAIIAIAALAELGVQADDGVGLLLTTDEEFDSARSRALIAHASEQADAVLVFEAALGPALKIARKGTSMYDVTFHGRAAHAGLDPERGINAMLEAAALASACATWGDADLGTTVVPTVLHAGTTTNTVPAEAILSIDARAWTRAEQERVDARIRAWTPSAGTMSIVGGIERPAMERRMSAGLLHIAQAVAAELGLGPLETAEVGGASDGNLTAAAGIATIDGLGAVGDGAHADHEWASVPALEPHVLLTAGMVRAILAEPTRAMPSA